MKSPKSSVWIVVAIALFAIAFIATNLYRQDQNRRLQDQSRPALPSAK